MKQVISTDQAPKAIGPYSQAILAGNTLYCAGQVAIVPQTGKLLDGGIKEQTEQVLKNIGAVLRAAGFEYTDVVKSTCLMADLANFADMNEVYGRYFNVNPPARSTYQVAKLPLGGIIEIEVIAVKA